MWKTRKIIGAHTTKLMVIRTRTTISSSQSQQIPIERKNDVDSASHSNDECFHQRGSKFDKSSSVDGKKRGNKNKS